jgi:uncharacterized lipoprotein YddW (UPF0748 family)
MIFLKKDFPDTATYNAYLNSGGSMSKKDWRRDNVNRMIRDTYNTIKSIKPNVHFGLSPFGNDNGCKLTIYLIHFLKLRHLETRKSSKYIEIYSN